MKKVFCVLGLLVSLNVNGQIPAYVPVDSLISYWSFSSNLNDESGNNNNGISIGNTSLTTDRFGTSNSAYYFDGDGDYIDCGNNTILDIATEISISAFIYADGFGQQKGIVSKMTNDVIEVYDLTAVDFGGHRLLWSFAGNELYSNQTLVTGTWYHVAATYDGITQKIYINGELDNSASISANAPAVTDHLSIGSHQPVQSTWSWNGKLDDIGLWKRALSQLEISALFNGTLDTCYYTVYDTVTTIIYDTIQVSVVDTNFITVTDILYIDVVTGMAAPVDINTITVYPNPTHTSVTIDNGYYPLLSGFTVKIVNSIGQIMFEAVINQQQYTLNLSSWTGNGMYFIHIIDPSGNTVDIRKIILD